MKVNELFSEADLEAIRDAVVGAEAKTSGEIVPCAVERSGGYSAALLRGALFGCLAAVSLAALAHRLLGFWSSPLLLWSMAPMLVGAAAGYLAVRSSPRLKRLLADEELMAERVRLAANAAFVEQEVFDTRERTGILLFLSLFERRVVILADAGIHQAVPAGTWSAVSDRLAGAIRQGRAAAGLIEAIAKCGQILEQHRVERRDDDVDELPNELRIGEAPDV